MSSELHIESLAVKYRPKSIKDLVGQDSVVSQIKGMLKQQRFPSAILIEGESGTGKTTTARMIARYLNCLNPDPDTHEPCGECRSCSMGDSHPDFIEKDMASERGIDDVRALIQSARAMPTVGKFRIFLIDEVHQITVQAANAFLKMLEEPPKRTMWLLATTNPEKMISTIIGRCHRFSLRKIPEDVMTKRLRVIAKREGVDLRKVDDIDQVLKAIYDCSNGRMRDSIQMLESVIFALGSGEKIDAQTLIKKFLTTTEGELEELAANLMVAILSGKITEAVRIIRTCQNARGLMHKLRWLSVWLIDTAIKNAKYTPVSGKIFASAAKSAGVGVKVFQQVQIQQMLLEAETQMNSMSLDESVLLMTHVGKIIIEFKSGA